ncbi:nuclear transport factor 2 family protein [Streptomyces sp. NPDC002680]|uniref:nuclear transport factor 2 family protein n=1 Tax=Streptomyces sp. NPDC002680 TaxID=3364659 RepID=UPI003692A422
MTVRTEAGAVADAYLTAFRTGDAEIFAGLFDAQGTFTYVGEDGAVQGTAPVSDLLGKWAERSDPGTAVSRVGVHAADDSLAVVELDFDQGTLAFRDVLVVARVEDTWKIVSKVSRLRTG